MRRRKLFERSTSVAIFLEVGRRPSALKSSESRYLINVYQYQQIEAGVNVLTISESKSIQNHHRWVMVGQRSLYTSIIILRPLFAFLCKLEPNQLL